MKDHFLFGTKQKLLNKYFYILLFSCLGNYTLNFAHYMDSFLKKRTLESECEDPKDDTSDALVVPESKRPNHGLG